MSDETIAAIQKFLQTAVVEAKPPAKHDPAVLESDLLARFQYLADFVGFGEPELKAINDAAPTLAKLVPDITAAVYRKLFSYEVTKKYFLPREEGFEGQLAADLEHLTLDHEQISMRKMILGKYLARLVTTSKVDLSFVKYLDYVGKIHTPKAGSKTLDIPLLHMNALMGFVNDALTLIVVNLGLPKDTEVLLIRAFTKLLWIQVEFISKHYV